MTTKSDFTTEEWQVILEAPPSAGMIVVTAQRLSLIHISIPQCAEELPRHLYRSLPTWTGRFLR